MKDMQREILNQVATGQISASEGAARIEALGAEPLETPAEAAPPPAEPVAGVRSVRVVSHLGSTTVVADPTVAVAVADGPHRARQDGETMTIEFGLLIPDNNFSFGPAGRALNGLSRRGEELVVRMNPDLALSAKLQAGEVKILGVHGPISAEVQAGDCRIEDFRGELTAFVQAGSLTARGKLDAGTSRIRCQMGEVSLNLERGSSVRISAHSTLGDVSIDGASVKRSESSGELVIGAGAATLELECTMGDIKLNAE
jgi:hypothetical protein